MRRWLILFYVLVVTQSAHFVEHIAQMIQIHVLGLQGAAARGIVGALNIEWVHFTWNVIVVIAAVALLVRFKENPWLWFTALFASWHAVEHAYILWIYLQTGVAGTPGLLSLGGVIHGGLPLARADLHFLYNLIETVPLIVAFFWQVRPKRVHARHSRALPAHVAPAGAMAFLGVAITASFMGPVKTFVTPDGELVCDKFYNLVQDVRAQSIPVTDIRKTIDEIESATPRADFNLQPSIPRFVHAAREAIASFSTYPTFDLMAYSETYAHMEAHEHTYAEVKQLSKACVAAGYTAKPRPPQVETGLDSTSRMAASAPPPDVLLKEPQEAVTVVQRYLHQKPWGFFGATCAAWAAMHYKADRADVVYSPQEDEWVVDMPRDAAALGPPLIRYHVNARTGLTHGDERNNVNSQFAEGCDKY